METSERQLKNFELHNYTLPCPPKEDSAWNYYCNTVKFGCLGPPKGGLLKFVHISCSCLCSSQEAWSGLSSCCSHNWRYGGPDCPPVVDLLFLWKCLSYYWSRMPPAWLVYIIIFFQIWTIHIFGIQWQWTDLQSAGLPEPSRHTRLMTGSIG